MSNAILNLRKNMTKQFFQGMALWFTGLAVAAILTMLILKDVSVVMLGFASLFGVVGWLVSFILSFKKQELDEINKKFELKADRTEITFLKDKLEHFEEMQKDIQHTINSIYKLLINPK